MIQWLRVTGGRLDFASPPDQAEIIRLVDPNETQLRMAQEISGAPPEFLVSAVDRDERPRVEFEDHNALLVLRVPIEDPTADVPVTTIALGIILTPTHIVTVCSQESPIWDAMRSYKPCVPSPVDRPMFVCAMFLTIARLYLSHLSKIQREVDSVERSVHQSMRNEMVIRMLNLEKCLVYFTTSLRAHEPIWARFHKIHDRELTEDELDMFDDVKIEFRQARELADIHSNILTGTMNAFASIISNNLNGVMKFLTSVTIIFMIPTWIASVYGMNVPLPFQSEPHAFLMVMSVSVLACLVSALVFFWKKYF